MNSVPQRFRATLTRSVSAAAALTLAAASWLIPAQPAAAEDSVTIPDVTLASCISARLSTESLPADFTATNLAKLTQLSCPSSGIADLTGLDSLTGLTRLSLATTTADLSPLTSLVGLQYLVIVDSNVTDASPIAALPNITQLLVKAPLVTSYGFALGHDNLVRGSFEVPLADDLADLATLPALSDLQLINPSGSARAAARTLVGVTQLRITTNTADGLAGLDVPPGVTQLYLNGAKLTDLTGLKPSSAPAHLTVSAAQLTSLDGINQLPNLTQLKTYASDLSDISAISGLIDLDSLDVSNSKVADLTPISGHTTLRTLNISNTAVSDISAISGLTDLDSLDVSNSKVADLTPISGHTTLRTLNISNTAVSDLSALTGLPLTSLKAPFLGLTEVTALAGFGPHATVELDGNHIKDLSPLPDDAEVSIGVQSLPDYPTATVGTPFDFGLRSANGQALCPQLPAAVLCTNGAATYPASGTYRTDGGSFSFTQYAGPNRTFTHPSITVQGKPVIDLDISVITGKWSPTPTVATIRWYRDGVDVTPSGAPSFYRITAADVGHRIKACYTASLDGYDTTTACTAPTAVVKPRQFGSIPSPRLAGTKRVGHTLTTVATGPWEEGSVRHYQWYRDGKKLRGETSASYRLRKADRRHLIKVRVTATKPGYTTVVRYTPSYRIR
ncbi:MAG: hypothetical protein CVT62_04505 [Actinobacteria bacterium HGW-Actinobacteria-2]|nr:MAG: hypothetical protein CVT62_04505 [Actinobacteria bacterium HGW-Actinobacteria-2]